MATETKPYKPEVGRADKHASNVHTDIYVESQSLEDMHAGAAAQHQKDQQEINQPMQIDTRKLARRTEVT